MIKQTDGTSYVARSGYGTFPINTEDWTIFIYFKYLNTPVGTANILSLFSGIPDFGASYFVIHSDTNLSNIGIEAFNGSDFQSSTYQTVGDTNSHWCAVTYNSTTHVLTLILDGVSVKTLTINLSSVTWQSIALLGNIGSFSPDVSGGYLDSWNNIKSIGDLTAQAASITPISMTGLLFNNPLQTSIDLTAHNNTLNQFTATGTITTDTTDPLLSVVAGPPTNTTPATALDVTIDSAFFQNVNTAGVATDVWYKYQSVSADDVLGLISFGDLTTYKPIVLVYGSLADANANIQYQVSTTFVQTDQNRAGIFPLPNDSSTPFFYFNVVRNGAVAASTLQFSLLRALSLPVPVGSIGINHDNTQGWPLTLLDQNTGYPIHYVKNFIGGNGGCTLPNGITIFTNSNTGAVEVINAQLSIIATITPIVANFASGNLVDKFVITNTTTPAPVRIVNPDGTVDPVTYSLTGNNCTALGLSRDSSIIYFVKTGANQPVKRWSVTTNTALSDLVAGISGYTCCLNEIIVLDDDSIVVNYFRTTPSKDIKIVNYSAAGATLHTYDFGPFTEFAGNQNRIAGAIDNLNQFWSWIKFTDDNSTGQFRRIKVSDGSILTFFTTIEYDFGQYQGLPINTPVRFGNPDSCPFWIVRTALFPGNNAKSGLYILTGTGGDFGLPDNPILRHDVDWIDTSAGTSESVKIPDPYYDTYLVGDE